MTTSRELKIVFAAHTSMGAPFVVGSHHLARQLARLGHRVAHLSTAITPAHAARLNKPDVRERFKTWGRGGVSMEERLTDCVPLAFLPWPVAGRLVTPRRNPALWTVPSLASLVARCGASPVDLLLVDQPRFSGMDRLLKPRIVIYRPTDLYAEFYPDPGTRAAERQIAHRADGFVATSEPVLAHLRAMDAAKPALLLENGVEYEHFATPVAAPAEYAAIAAPRLVYVGALDERFDFDGVAGLARQMPAANIVLVGPPGPLARKAAGLPNIHLLGPRPYATLPGYLQHASAGLLPLSDHPANSGRSPMKLYEYAAAGLPVVARATPELLRRAEPFLRLYAAPQDMATTTAAALAVASDPASAQARARSYSWTARARTLLEFALALPHTRIAP